MIRLLVQIGFVQCRSVHFISVQFKFKFCAVQCTARSLPDRVQAEGKLNGIEEACVSVADPLARAREPHAATARQDEQEIVPEE